MPKLALESKPLSLDEIGPLICQLESSRNQFENLGEELNKLVIPTQPLFVEDLDQWDDYLNDVDEYNENRDTILKTRDSAYSTIIGIETKFKKNLPSGTWFKIITDKGERWISIGNSIWDSRHVVLTILTEKPELPVKEYLSISKL